MSNILENLKKNIPKYVPEVSEPPEDDVSVLRYAQAISERNVSVIEGCGLTVEDEVLRICASRMVEEIIKKKLYKLYTISSRKGNFGGMVYQVEIKVKK